MVDGMIGLERTLPGDPETQGQRVRNVAGNAGIEGDSAAREVAAGILAAGVTVPAEVMTPDAVGVTAKAADTASGRAMVPEAAPARRLGKLAASLEGWSLADWEYLPDIGLYMDQVVTYLERQLGFFSAVDGAKPMTAAMINNYAKDGVIPRAEGKKYSREHVALLLVVGTLKQVLSMTDLARLLDLPGGKADAGSLYARFRDFRAEAMGQVVRHLADAAGSIPSGDAGSDETLRALALRLAVEAEARSVASERILALLDGSKGNPDATEGVAGNDSASAREKRKKAPRRGRGKRDAGVDDAAGA